MLLKTQKKKCKRIKKIIKRKGQILKNENI